MIPLPLDRLLVVGSTGLVGSKVASHASNYGFEAYGTRHERKSILSDSVELDITDPTATLELIQKIRPSVIVNTAAVTNVDYCETNREEARRVNADGVKNLAAAARKNQSRLVQVSTDYVFDGYSGHYTEADSTNPLQYYGETKLEAENMVSDLPSFAIARPSVIYGWAPSQPVGEAGAAKPMNFAMFVLDRLGKGDKVKAIRDQYASPTFADNLGDALLLLAKSSENGIFHTAGRSCLSRYEFAIKLAEIFGYSSGQVEPVFSSEFKQLAKRPRNSCLRVDKAERSLGMSLLTADQGIKEMRNQRPLDEHST